LTSFKDLLDEQENGVVRVSSLEGQLNEHTGRLLRFRRLSEPPPPLPSIETQRTVSNLPTALFCGCFSAAHVG